MLTGKTFLITGVLMESSIAFHVAKIAQEQGAQVILTSFGRTMKITRTIAKRLPQEAPVIELDVTSAPAIADFARRLLKLDARSIDPSRYAKTGGDWLGVPVESALLGEGSSADGEVFDLVYSSEVVEPRSRPRARP